jgi:hypothetical protein
MYFKHNEIFTFFCSCQFWFILFQFRRFKKEYFTNVQFLKNLMFKQEKCYHKEMVITSDPFTNADCIIIAFAQPFPSKDSTNASNELYIIIW